MPCPWEKEGENSGQAIESNKAEFTGDLERDRMLWQRRVQPCAGRPRREWRELVRRHHFPGVVPQKSRIPGWGARGCKECHLHLIKIKSHSHRLATDDSVPGTQQITEDKHRPSVLKSKGRQAWAHLQQTPGRKRCWAPQEQLKT